MQIFCFVNDARFFKIQFEQWAVAFQKAGWPVTVFSPKETVLDREIITLEAGNIVHQLPFQRKKITVYMALLTVIFTLQKARQSPHGTIFHLITILPILLCGLPLRILNRPCVYTITGMGTIFSSHELRHRVMRIGVAIVYRFLFNHPKAKVCLCNHDDFFYFKNTLKIFPSRMELVPGSGASQKKFPFSQYKPKNSNPIILIPARLIEDKGIFEAIEASKILMKNGIAHTMKFLGDIDPGNPTSLTKIQVEKLALENPQVTFLGFQSDVPEFLASADIVCLPSYREGLPTALVEAMAVGRAIVGFDSIGIRDIIQHERTGLLAIRKSSEDLAKQLTRLIENPELRLELSKNAHSYFKENLEIERIIDQMKKIYLETSAIE